MITAFRKRINKFFASYRTGYIIKGYDVYLLRSASMYQLSPQELIARLVARGFSQADIARKCKVSQSTVSKIMNGKQTTTSFEFVDALRRLYKKGKKE